MKKISITILIVAVSVLSAYWVKNFFGMNIFKSYSISKYFPFKYLQTDHTLHPKSGDTIIDESFNTHSIFKRNWSDLWMREKGKVIRGYDTKGFNNSRCLLIKSSSDKSWVYPSLKSIEVKQGDVFSYSGFSSLHGEDNYALFCLVSFDKDKKVLQWAYEKSKIIRKNRVVKIEKRFTVPHGIASIKFRIAGRGTGEFRFDDIEFRKL